jgi:hypothetical protein
LLDAPVKFSLEAIIERLRFAELGGSYGGFAQICSTQICSTQKGEGGMKGCESSGLKSAATPSLRSPLLLMCRRK